MTATGYPVFTGGMTLTKDDLNTLREFLDVQDSVLGRLIGFGIACGLDGTVRSTTLTVSAGLAVDQDGRGLVVAADRTMPLAASEERFSFVDPEEGGITPVLVFREQDQAAPECGTASCDPHAPLRLRSAEIVLVEGRLRTGAAEFATDRLLQLTPMTATAKGVRGDFDGIRDAILERLDAKSVTLHTTARARLEGLELKGIAAVQVYRAAFLNQVLFATIELMRCLALRGAACLRDEETPGVALGWAPKQGGWDCRYRHSFLPSDGLSMALLGGRCGDPCSLIVDRIEAILDSYAEPAAPAPSDPPKPPPKGDPAPYCPPKRGRYGRWHSCYITIPEQFPENWFDDYVVRPDEPFFVDPLWDPRPDYEVIDDALNLGTLSVVKLFGTDVVAAEAALREELGGHVTQPDVLVVNERELATTEGFTPDFNIAVGDRFVLVQDDLGKVVATGRVPVQHTLQNVGSNVQTARTDAANALGIAQGLETGFHAEIATRVEGLRAELAETFVQANELQDLVRGFEIQAPETHDFETRIEEVRVQLQQQLEQVHTETLTQVQHEVEQVRAETRTVNTRVDNVILAAARGDVATQPAFEHAVTEKPVVTEEFVQVVDSLKLAVESAATTKQRAAVAENLAAVDEAMTRLSATQVTAAEAPQVLGVLENLTLAVRDAGASEARVTELEATLDVLRTRFR